MSQVESCILETPGREPWGSGSKYTHEQLFSRAELFSSGPGRLLNPSLLQVEDNTPVIFLFSFSLPFFRLSLLLIWRPFVHHTWLSTQDAFSPMSIVFCPHYVEKQKMKLCNTTLLIIPHTPCSGGRCVICRLSVPRHSRSPNRLLHAGFRKTGIRSAETAFCSFLNPQMPTLYLIFSPRA